MLIAATSSVGLDEIKEEEEGEEVIAPLEKGKTIRSKPSSSLLRENNIKLEKEQDARDEEEAGRPEDSPSPISYSSNLSPFTSPLTSSAPLPALITSESLASFAGVEQVIKRKRSSSVTRARAASVGVEGPLLEECLSPTQGQSENEEDDDDESENSGKEVKGKLARNLGMTKLE